jgi:hypothetical protein
MHRLYRTRTSREDRDRPLRHAIVLRGERKEAFESSRQGHGITREAVWIQQTPGGDFAVVYLEADDLQAAFAGLGSSQEPFDRWFRDVIREVHGIDLAEGFPPPEQLLDYSDASTSGDASKPQGAVA